LVRCIGAEKMIMVMVRSEGKIRVKVKVKMEVEVDDRESSLCWEEDLASARCGV
jgi:hypothetical protein